MTLHRFATENIDNSHDYVEDDFDWERDSYEYADFDDAFGDLFDEGVV